MPTPQRRQASRTALRVAALRAMHQDLDKPPLFVDPLAARILGPGGAEAVESFLDDPAGTVRLRTILAVRSRLAEDALADAVRRGVTQYVILGAGLDTFGYRHAYPALRVYEVDHAGTQAWKLQCLAEAGIAVPDTMRHIGLDFETGDPIAALVASGFQPTQPAVFAMLGVTFYVERAALMKTFAAVAQCAAGSELIFDYVPDFEKAPEPVRSIYLAVAARVAAEGEPWITCLEPQWLDATLRGLGFTEVVNRDAKALAQRYLADRTDGMVMPPLGNVVHARVG